MPRTRPGRVRTKRTNRREPLLLSAVAPQDVNLREGEARSIVCPDCRTWRRLMGETMLKIREHRGEELSRCPGSNQLVIADISVEQWGAQLLAVDTTAMHRRPTTVRRKPKLPTVPAVSRMGVPEPTLLNSYRAHRAACRSCRSGRPCDHGLVLRQRVHRIATQARRRQHQLHAV